MDWAAIEASRPRGAPDGVWFDRRAAAKACNFFPRYLRHTEGEWAGRPFELQPWESERFIAPIFGWKLPDGLRLIRVGYLELPRKNGKTELAAGISLLALLGDAEFGGQGYASAVNEDQSKIVFHKAGIMVQMSSELSRRIEVLKTSLYCAELIASFKPLSARPSGKHGFSPSFSISDELHEWADGELADVIHKGTASRRQPLEIYITTAGLKNWGFGWEIHDRALKVLDGTLVDPQLWPLIYAAGEDDDWTSEATWRKANPNYGISVKPEYMAAECRKAQESARKENDFRRYHLNLWTEQVTRWLRLDDWDANAGAVDWPAMEELLAGRECYAAADLSQKIDVTALALVFPPVAADPFWSLLVRFFLPEAQIAKAAERDRLPYGDWVRRGVLKATPGTVVDYAFVGAQLLADARKFRIREVAYDPWNATQFAIEMSREGLTMTEFGQGYKSMSEPTKELEALLVNQSFRHGGQPMLREMAKSVSVISDPAGNIKPDKGKSRFRIDGIVAAIMGLGRAIGTAAARPVFGVAVLD